MNIAARTQGVTKGLMNPLTNSVTPDAGTFHYSIPPLTNVNSEIYPHLSASIPPRGVYTYPYMPSLVIPNPPITQMDGNLVKSSLNLYLFKAQKN